MRCSLVLFAGLVASLLSAAVLAVSPTAATTGDPQYPYEICSAVCTRAMEQCKWYDSLWWCSAGNKGRAFTVPVLVSHPIMLVPFVNETVASGPHCACTGSAGSGSILARSEDAVSRCVAGMRYHNEPYTNVVVTVLRLVSHTLQIRFRWVFTHRISGNVLLFPGFYGVAKQLYRFVSNVATSVARGLSYAEYGVETYGPPGLASSWLLAIVAFAVGIIRGQSVTQESDWLFAWMVIAGGVVVCGVHHGGSQLGWLGVSGPIVGLWMALPYLVVVGTVWVLVVHASAVVYWVLFGVERFPTPRTTDPPPPTNETRRAQCERITKTAWSSFGMIYRYNNPQILLGDFSQFLLATDAVLLIVAFTEMMYFECVRTCGVSPWWTDVVSRWITHNPWNFVENIINLV